PIGRDRRAAFGEIAFVAGDRGGCVAERRLSLRHVVEHRVARRQLVRAHELGDGLAVVARLGPREAGVEGRRRLGLVAGQRRRRDRRDRERKNQRQRPETINWHMDYAYRTRRGLSAAAPPVWTRAA